MPSICGAVARVSLLFLRVPLGFRPQGPQPRHAEVLQHSDSLCDARYLLPCHQVDARLAVCFHVRIEIPVKSDSNEGGEFFSSAYHGRLRVNARGDGRRPG